MVGKDEINANAKHSNVSRRTPLMKVGSEPRHYFPFKQGYLAVATLRVGVEGIQMTADGKHITSFAYREVHHFQHFLYYLWRFIKHVLILYLFLVLSELGAMASQ